MFFIRSVTKYPKTYVTIAAAFATFFLSIKHWLFSKKQEIYEEIIDNARKAPKKKKQEIIKGIQNVLKSYFYEDENNKLTEEKIRKELLSNAEEIKKVKIILLKNNQKKIVGFIAFNFGEFKGKKETIAFMNSLFFILPKYRGKSSMLCHYGKELARHILSSYWHKKTPIYFDVMTPNSYRQAAKLFHGLSPISKNPIPKDLEKFVKDIINNSFISSGFKYVEEKEFYVLKTPFPFIVPPQELTRFKNLMKKDNNVKFFFEKTGFPEKMPEKKEQHLMHNQLFVMLAGYPQNLLMTLYNIYCEMAKRKLKKSCIGKWLFLVINHL
ncbi:MAG: hypothetical protein PVI75_00595 [Gammaproteobacteria bacterium]